MVTTGDGLYVDPVEENRYVYRGANPDNYLLFNDELWRVMSVETDGTIKIRRSTSVRIGPFDDAGIRYDGQGYCSNETNGCKVWGSDTTTLSSSGANTATMPRQVNSVEYELPSEEASLNIYLNTTYYDSLGPDRQYIINHLFSAGVLRANSSQTLAEDVQQEQTYKWRGKIGLFYPTDYVKASINSECQNVYLATSAGGILCFSDNYLSDGGLTMIAYSNAEAYYVWFRGTSGQLQLRSANTADSSARPVVHLTPNLRIDSGTGTSVDPYVVRGMGESDVSVSINSALALEVSVDELVLEPVVNGGTEKGDLVVSVSTNDINGYRLVMSIAEDGSGTSLKYVNTSDGFSIPSTASTGELVANAWGYTVGEAETASSFKPIPTYSSPDTLKTKSGLSLNDMTAVTFGVRVNMDIPAGTYQNTISFTAIANI